MFTSYRRDHLGHYRNINSEIFMSVGLGIYSQHGEGIKEQFILLRDSNGKENFIN